MSANKDATSKTLVDPDYDYDAPLTDDEYARGRSAMFVRRARGHRSIAGCFRRAVRHSGR